MPNELSPAGACAAIESAFPAIRAELERLVRIPSVSAAGFDAQEVRRSALATARWLRRSGFADVTLLEVEGAHPAVYGAIHGSAGSGRAWPRGRAGRRSTWPSSSRERRRPARCTCPSSSGGTRNCWRPTPS